jgi:hypothetical protein
MKYIIKKAIYSLNLLQLFFPKKKTKKKEKIEKRIHKTKKTKKQKKTSNIVKRN